MKQALYTVFSFCYFILLAVELTVIGFVLITLCGATDNHKLRYHRILCRRARFVVNHIPGTTFTFNNPHGETFSSPAIIIANHQSHLDLMAIIALTPKLIILTKDWVWRNPFYGIIIRYADYLPVSETEEMTRHIRTMMEKGYSVMVFPEGTRSVDCRIQRFHKGAFYLAEQLHTDILPVLINGFGKALPKLSHHLHPADMTLEIMPRIPYQETTRKGYREMTKQVHRMYKELCK